MFASDKEFLGLKDVNNSLCEFLAWKFLKGENNYNRVSGNSPVGDTLSANIM